MRGWRPWSRAMAEALTGPAGFYRSPGAARQHFRTAAQSGVFAGCIARLVCGLDEQLGRPASLDVVDLGAGDGGLLLAMLAGLPAEVARRTRPVAVDLAPRPAGLPATVGWRATLPASVSGIVLAHEWLDTLPVDVVEDYRGRLRTVEVDPRGQERLGGRPDQRTVRWLNRHATRRLFADRAEAGWRRDRAWTGVVQSVRRGIAVAVDYPAPLAGGATLTGYRAGRQTRPVPDGSMDITAHVRFAAVAAAGRRARPGVHTVRLEQREALRRLGAPGRPTGTPARDPTTQLRALAASGEAAQLCARGGFGDFEWLVQAVDTVLPEILVA